MTCQLKDSTPDLFSPGCFISTCSHHRNASEMWTPADFSVDLGRVVHGDLTLCVASLRRMIGFTHFSLGFSKITWTLAVWQQSHMAGQRPPKRTPVTSQEMRNVKMLNLMAIKSFFFWFLGLGFMFSTWNQTRRPAMADFNRDEFGKIHRKKDPHNILRYYGYLTSRVFIDLVLLELK